MNIPETGSLAMTGREPCPPRLQVLARQRLQPWLELDEPFTSLSIQIQRGRPAPM
jgi:hypothetical protein